MKTQSFISWSQAFWVAQYCNQYELLVVREADEGTELHQLESWTSPGHQAFWVGQYCNQYELLVVREADEDTGLHQLESWTSPGHQAFWVGQ